MNTIPAIMLHLNANHVSSFAEIKVHMNKPKENNIDKENKTIIKNSKLSLEIT